MELVKHIRDLLYHHDCVVVPGFGGFVTNERPARIDSASDSFYPPAREVGFNARLDHNDGVLISYLSARLSLNYVDARKLVSTFAEEVNRKIKEGRVVHFDGIGQFSADRQGRLQFDPDPAANFLTDAYGLSFFRYPSLEDAGNARKMRVRKSGAGERRIPAGARRLMKYAAVGIPLVAALTWGAMNRDVIREFSFNLSSINPFSAVVDTNIRSVPADEADAAYPEDYYDLRPEDVASQRNALLYEEPEPAAEDAVAQAAPDIEEPGREVSEEIVADAGTPAVSAAPAVARTHYLVAGSFRSRQNALMLSEKLSLEGYDAEVVEGDSGLHRVSLYSSHDSGEALAMLRRLRGREGMEDLWMLSR